ncbi:MAG: DUF362 domain-containing protein [Candidatus Omnitrophica bacterium]|nr:DUF362 domain-containing protein [Candidatus Omnitrophota bacterium]
MAKSKVYFIPVTETDNKEVIIKKLQRLIQESKLLDFVLPQEDIAIKLHFGEEGNTGFVKPEYIKVICDIILEKNAKPFLIDTNTLYKGRRTDSKEHLKLAEEHGFNKKEIGSEIIIPDDSLEENTIDIKINQRFVKTAYLVRAFIESDAIIGISHFKGHIMTGFGGALKNLGMGCATRKGKLFQHSDIAPIIYKQKCTGCGECIKICPQQVIYLKENKAVIDGKRCIGCASCIAVCAFSAIDVNWESGSSTLPEKMVEYVFALLKDKRDKTAFLNFAIKITKECDCIAKDDPRICADIGILASFDPVSIDKASYDLVVRQCGRDIFKEVHPKRDSHRQLNHAYKLGIGNLDYELISLS